MKSQIEELIKDIKERVLYLQELGVSEIDAPIIELSSKREKTVEAVRSPRFVPERPPVSIENGGKTRLEIIPKLSQPFDERPERPETNTKIKTSEVRKTLKPPSNDETLFGDIAPTLKETSDTIESIRAEIGDCTRCDLCSQGRKQIVHSTGNFNADLMFVGEAPGADEDEQGFPFVGRAGQLLTKIIEGIGLKREDVFIGNINRCRPPGNRQPLPAETAACRPFLLREVAVVRPKVIVVLGNTATQNLLDIKTPISKLRGNFQDYFGVKVMPTFHPAYLLRDPHKKREVWEDMKKVRDYLNSL